MSSAWIDHNGVQNIWYTETWSGADCYTNLGNNDARMRRERKLARQRAKRLRVKAARRMRKHATQRGSGGDGG